MALRAPAGVLVSRMPKAVRLMKQRSMILLETIVVVVGAAAFGLGLLVWHR